MHSIQSNVHYDQQDGGKGTKRFVFSQQLETLIFFFYFVTKSKKQNMRTITNINLHHLTQEFEGSKLIKIIHLNYILVAGTKSM